MMLVDSSVWVDFLHARATPQTDHLKRALLGERVLTADLVIAEVLQGTRSERAFAIASAQLLNLDVVTIAGPEIAVQAARHYRALRERGITIRKTIDTLIATRCIVDNIPLLYADRDFDPFVAHLGLRSAMA
ncbi:PIN domain nuclease [uncultured Sphingomonas sp.]|uniref:type II toxin-antitoxin system VapC family toxin n=1 Tax=uncultured Sphingomonas sp. TaxID=158754 RepID=UPI00258E881F|nr:PIN domain nuclease [uncultured Sphingomonas sp.]